MERNCKIKRTYKPQNKKGIVEPCERPGLCDPEADSFCDRCRLCGKIG